jgi:hypothetical protein
MDTLTAQMERRFIARIVDHLQSEYAKHLDETLPAKELTRRVEDGIARARAWGLSGEMALVEYVVLLFTVGRQFDEHPCVRQILGDPAIEPDFRPRMLGVRLTAAEWDELRAASGTPAAL